MTNLQKALAGGLLVTAVIKRVLEDGAVEFTTFSTEVDDGLTVSKSATVVRFRNLSGEWKAGR